MHAPFASMAFRTCVCVFCVVEVRLEGCGLECAPATVKVLPPICATECRVHKCCKSPLHACYCKLAQKQESTPNKHKRSHIWPFRSVGGRCRSTAAQEGSTAVASRCQRRTSHRPCSSHASPHESKHQKPVQKHSLNLFIKSLHTCMTPRASIAGQVHSDDLSLCHSQTYATWSGNPHHSTNGNSSKEVLSQ